MALANQDGSVGSYFNNDISVDILWHNEGTGANKAWFMSGTDKVGSTSLPTLDGWDLEGINDFNSDGEADILWRNYATGENRIWFMNDTSLLYSVDLATVSNPNRKIEGTGDFNGDGQTDILWRNYRNGTNSVWLMNGSSKVSGQSIPTVGNLNWQIEGTGDFNGDGQTDILWRNYNNGNNKVWLMNGTSKVSGQSIQAVGNLNWQIEGTGDFNGDGQTDILWRNYNNGNNKIWLMNGTSKVSGVRLPAASNLSWKPFAQASMTVPKPDLVVQNQSAPSSAILGDTISLSTYTQNNGQASAGYSYIRYWLSDDAILNTSTDRYLGEDYVASLNAGSSEYDTFDFTYNSSWGTGTKYIFFQADGYSYVTESNESNNTAYRTISIAPPPSITVASPNGGNTLQMGQSYNITWNDNFSDNVRIWLYKGNQYLQTIVDSTESDGSYTWTLPTNLTPSNDYKIAVGIPGSTVTTYDFSDSDFSIVAPSQPDLVVQSQYAPSSATVGETISISAYTKNSGQASAGSSYIRYWLSDDATLNINTDRYLGEDYVASLSTGSSEYDTFDFVYDSTWGTGTKYIFFQADVYNDVTESNESNNVAYQAISLAAPSVTVIAPNGGNTLQMGQSYNITWSDNFSDNVRIDLYKGSSLVQTLSSSTASDGSFTWTPSTSLMAGNDYRIKITSASDSNVSDYSNSYFTISQPDNGFNIQIDYRFDTQGWFTSDKRAALEAAVDIWEAIILDEFSNISIGTGLSVRDPQTGTMTSLTSDYIIDDLVIFVGARDLSSLGVGGPSGIWGVGSEMENRYKGSDFEPWTGSVTFDSNTSWFFDSTPLMSDIVPANQYDFVSVAVHEIGHVLGIGTSDAFDNLVSLYNGNYYFVGSNATAKNGGYSLPLYTDASHIEEGHDETGATGEAALDPTLMVGTRKLPTVLDVAILDDIGYSVDYSRAYSNV